MVTAHEVVQPQNRQAYLGHEKPLSEALQVGWRVIVLKDGVHPVICHECFQDAIVEINGDLSGVHSK